MRRFEMVVRGVLGALCFIVGSGGCAAHVQDSDDAGGCSTCEAGRAVVYVTYELNGDEKCAGYNSSSGRYEAREQCCPSGFSAVGISDMGGAYNVVCLED